MSRRIAAVVVASLVVLAGCRGRPGQPAQPLAHGRPGVLGTEAAAPGPGSAERTAVTPRAPVPEAVTAPPGTDALVPVPADVARGVRLVQVARGLSRPV